MKNAVILGIVTISTLLIAKIDPENIDQAKLKAEIKKAKADKKILETRIKKLQAKLPPNEALLTNVKLGYIKTDGNTQTQTFSLDTKAKKAWKLNILEISINAQYGESDSLETNNKYRTELSYKYSMSKNLSITYLLGYKYDKFSSYDYQIYTGPGLQYLALKTKKQKLNFEGSILYSIDKLQKKYIVSNPNFKELYSSYRTKINYDLQVFKNLKFNQELSYRSSFEEVQNYFIYSKSAFSSKISNMLSTGISYKIDYTNQVAIGVNQKDTTMEAFLSIDY